MSGHGSEKRRAQEDPERSGAWGAGSQDEYYTRPRREALTSSQRTGDWQWVRRTEMQGAESGASTGRSDRSKPWTLWAEVAENKRRPEGDAMSVESDSKRSWSQRGYHQAGYNRAEQGCQPRPWERYPDSDQPSM